MVDTCSRALFAAVWPLGSLAAADWLQGLGGELNADDLVAGGGRVAKVHARFGEMLRLLRAVVEHSSSGRGLTQAGRQAQMVGLHNKGLVTPRQVGLLEEREARLAARKWR
ncbi:hypothetical protein HYH02_010182 [Chlamydomonas schloesseri]|uniref:Uncharacterized protein n=1 Tax=Chlamydomonas schloesseri TaxID=2026947 RepID=A0A835T8F4_9CHLO|nr:hypothetical protein HYH02_010182 [Chlamydomonas schloesseri]|eukprot:KAG2440603.1 hypothetical protein HYH02_010182 [Chlamydomonas schloesseri]